MPTTPTAQAGPVAQPRYRVVLDNDYAGDPDALVQLAHHLLSPSVEVVAVVGSHLGQNGFSRGPGSAQRSVDGAAEVVDALGMTGRVPVLAGSDWPLADAATPHRSAGAEAIIAEALRDDTDLPLFVCLGGGLTELASAWLLEPAVGGRMTALWIGGPEHFGVAAPPGSTTPEWNLGLDLVAGQVVFGDADVPLWQVPRDAYRQCLVSEAELLLRVRPHGRLGALLYERLHGIDALAAEHGLRLGETWCLGDSPLVLLTALQGALEPDAASSASAVVPTPRLDERGGYVPRPDGRPLRVFTRLDVRLLVEDLVTKLALAAQAEGPPTSG